MSATNLVNFNSVIRASFESLAKKYENLYRNINLDYTDYFSAYCYRLMHDNSEFTNELKQTIISALDFCVTIPHNIGLIDDEELYERIRDIVCKYSENEFIRILNIGVWLKELYDSNRDNFLDEELIKFLNSRYGYDCRKFNCFLVLVNYYYTEEKEAIYDSIIKAFDITDICYGKDFLTVFYNFKKDVEKFLSYSEFCEFFIRRSKLYDENDVISKIDFEKLPEYYNSRENKLITIHNF